MRFKAAVSHSDTGRDLDFFIFTAPDYKGFKTAMQVLKTRHIVQENPDVANFVSGLAARISLIVECVKWEITGQDHIAIAVQNSEEWALKYKALGAEVELVTSDSNPGEPSSMKLWKVNWGNIRIALIEPISREDLSQVEKFVRAHGDHSFQHVAIGVTNLDEFVRDMERIGANFLGPVLEREDAFGRLKQVFGCVFSAMSGPDEGQFYEFVERPSRDENLAADGSKKPMEFSNEAARMLFSQIDKASKEKDQREFF